MLRFMFALFLSLIISEIAAGDTRTVNQNGGGDFTTIQAAINASTDGDLILVAPGTYYENVILNNDIELRSEIGPEVTIIDGGQNTSVVWIRADWPYPETTTDAIISGFTIRNGRGNTSVAYPTGAGIHLGSNFGVHACTIKNNIITGNNHPSTTKGGGIYIAGGPSIIENNIIHDNMASAAGAGICAESCDGAVIKNNKIYNNYGEEGGTAGSWLLGGGIHATGCSKIEIIHNEIYENEAVHAGGLSFTSLDASDYTIMHNKIHHNHASNIGGGAYCNGAWYMLLDFTNNLIYKNTAGNYGGVYIANHYGAADPTYIVNNTVVYNSSLSTGGNGIVIKSYGSRCQLWNNIIWGNFPYHQLEADGYTTLTVEYCDIEGCSGAGTNINADPIFVDSASDNYELVIPSPCGDAGSNAAPWPDPPGMSGDVDIYGDPRIHNNIVDIGADEGSSPPNMPPVADAGPDQTVDEWSLVTLDGSGSNDPDEGPFALTYEWTQVAGPEVIFDPYAAVTTFDAPNVDIGGATLTFQLVVFDGEDSSDPDIINVIVKNVNRIPVANAGDAQIVNEESPVVLDGTGSYDPDDEPLTYWWVQTAGAPVILSDPTSSTPSFTAPIVGVEGDTLEFMLVVNDGIDDSDPDYVNVLVENVNHAPMADAGLDQNVDELTLVTLDGTGSSDPDGEELTYSWVQTDGPAVTLSDATSATPTFTAPDICCGDIAYLEFELIVNDGIDDSDPDRVTIGVRDTNAPPDCSMARASLDYLWPPNHKMHPITIVGVTDPDDDDVIVIVTSVTQDEPVDGLGDGDTGPDAVIQGDTVLIRAERSGLGNGRVYRIDFTAIDSANGSCSGYVTLFVPHDKKKPIQAVDDGQLYDSTVE